MYNLVTAICGSPPSISNGSPGTPTSTVAGGTVTYTPVTLATNVQDYPQ